MIEGHNYPNLSSVTYKDAIIEICQLVNRGKIKEAAKYLETIVDEVTAIYEDGKDKGDIIDEDDD